MSGLAQYNDMIVRRKDALYISREAYCRTRGISKEQFADELRDRSGRNVTPAMVKNWVERGALQHQMPEALNPFWEELTGSTAHYSRRMPQSERDAAMQAINLREATA
jgi:hypothetical protein